MTPIPDHHSKTTQKSLLLLSIYRLTVASMLVFVGLISSSWANYNSHGFWLTSLAYFMFAGIAIATTKTRWSGFHHKLMLEVIGDIGFITTLMHFSGGVKSSYGLLLVVATAAAGLVSRGRLAIFYAAIASIVVLLEQSWRVLTLGGRLEDFTHAGLLSLSFFATAWLAHSFAKRAEQSETLASQRSIDLANMAEVNQRIIRDMPSGVLVVDHLLQLRQLNHPARILLALNHEIDEGAQIDACSPALAKLLKSWMTGSGNKSLFQLIVAGRTLQIELASVGAGREYGAVVFISDMSQIQSQAQQLKLAALGRLTANIAHEIRNPLSAIGHATQLLQEDERTDKTQQRLLDIVDNNVQRLDNIVKDVLQLNRRDRANLKNVITIKSFLQDFKQQFCRTENVSENLFLLDMPKDTELFAYFDNHHLHQILWNLCRNAWRHGHQREGSLRINVYLSEQRIIFDVCDDGSGVSEESFSHIFEPFFTTENSGTGLGLYIARELCHANDAQIEYAGSLSGAIFRVYARRQE